MADVPERLQPIHREALNARELTLRMAVVPVLAVAIVLVVLTVRDGFQTIDLAYILAPTLIIGLMMFLAHRVGAAYAIIRHLDGSGSD